MYRIHIKSSTAYFRNPVTMTGIQQTFEAPPLSTIYGLISAAVGKKIENETVGYIFEYRKKSVDYEMITTPISKRNLSKIRNEYEKIKANPKNVDRHDILRGCFGAIPINREILFDCNLYLYLENDKLAEAFKNPYYTLLLGRSEDLAFVRSIEKVELKNLNISMNVGKTILPFDLASVGITGRITTMPVIITEEIPRKVLKSGIFIVLDDYIKIHNNKELFYFDEELGKGIYLHRFQ